MTTTDRIRVRSRPRIADDSIAYRPLLPLGAKVLVIEGPVRDSGYDWYRVAPISLALRDGITEGWVAAADRDGTPWLEPTAGRPYIDLRANVRLQNRPTTKSVRITTGDHTDLRLYLVTRSLDPAACRITHSVTPDKPDVQATPEHLAPAAVLDMSLIDGRHEIAASCPTSAAGVITADFRVLVMDGQPERCAGFAFPNGEISIRTLAELTSGMIGTWEGCVTTPWVPPYWVTFTFRPDGSYSASSPEVFDESPMVALYYGTDEDAPAKRYAINDLQASLKGLGQIDVAFQPGQADGANRDELRNIRLMGDLLEFELFHQSAYGPVTFQLRRG